MKHARPDYNRIQDPAGLIPEAEPVFLLRAQDASAPGIVRLWCEQQRATPGHDPKLVELAWKHAEAMTAWQRRHGSKVPDGPRKG